MVYNAARGSRTTKEVVAALFVVVGAGSGANPHAKRTADKKLRSHGRRFASGGGGFTCPPAAHTTCSATIATCQRGVSSMSTPRPPGHDGRQLPVPTSVRDGQLYVVRAPAQAGDPIAMWTALHGMLPSRPRRRAGARPWISAELIGHAGQVQLRLWLPVGQEPFVSAIVRAAYPGTELIEVAPEIDSDEYPLGGFAGASKVRLRDTWLPLRTDHAGDALAPLFATLARTSADERVVVALAIRPRPDGWQRRARRHARRLLGERTGLAYRMLFGEPQPHEPRSIDRQHARRDQRQGRQRRLRRRDPRADPGSDPGRRRRIPASRRGCVAPLRRSDVADRSTALRRRARARVASDMHRRRFPTARLSRAHAERARHALASHRSTNNPYVDTLHAPKIAPGDEVPSDGRVFGTANYPGRERPVATPWHRDASPHVY